MTQPRAGARRELMGPPALLRALQKLAGAIRRDATRLPGTVLVGVQTRGVPLARRLARLIESKRGASLPVGMLDITLYRDDLTQIAAQPMIKGTDIPVSIDGKHVVLVDDVLFTGRTVRAALDELIDFGRPASIRLCVLVDRGHRELPIRADFVAASVKTARGDIVQVLLREEDGEDRVLLLRSAKDTRPTRGRP